MTLSLDRAYDVVVVGAGPAGATLAYGLARRGVDALLLEKERLPRYKCCAGAVSARAARLLGFDISEVVEDTIYSASVACGRGRPFLGRSDQPLAYMVSRARFDHLLVKRAQQAGARLAEGQRVVRVEVDGHGALVSTPEGNFRSRVVVGADGAYSTVARQLGMPRDLEYVAALQSEVAVSQPELARWRSRVHIEVGGLPGAYCWVFPKRDHLSIGAGCPAASARGLRLRHQEFLASLGLDHSVVVRSGGHLIPGWRGPSTIAMDRALLLGDAAGLADRLSGEGIYHAVYSAQLAAPVIEGYLQQGGPELHAYQRAVEQKMVTELRTARMASKIAQRFAFLIPTMLQRDERAWRGCCRLLRGELDYATIKARLGGFRGVFAFLSRMRQSD